MRGNTYCVDARRPHLLKAAAMVDLGAVPRAQGCTIETEVVRLRRSMPLTFPLVKDVASLHMCRRRWTSFEAARR